ncbi:MAG: site-2 protease family protein [Limnospira maxima]|uniref:Peptidase M50 n=2 Tax=Oscillatoriales TaxID=1150 RepID=A0A9P1NYZ9_9CYAN|nr:site-2 protease family protein [Limnospira indica]CDM94509.1 Peptidase M50 [Limnospira indica PCC 8005]SMN23025.1 peptidase M50 [Arthrospira sp. SRM16]
MFIASDNTTIFILLISLGILAWGYYRARPYGKAGILSWLQSVSLMGPWLLFFGLTAFGIYINFVSILLLFVAATGIYIYLGRKLRSLAEELDDNNPQIPQEGETPTPEAVNLSDTSRETPGTPQTETTAINPEDLKVIQGIFGIDTFFATETFPYQEGVIFKGNLRSDPEEVHGRLSRSLQEKMGDRFRLFLIENPDGKPVVIVLPSSKDPQPATDGQKILALVLLVITVATIFQAGGLLLGFDFFGEHNRYGEVLPIAIGIGSVLAAHEIAHQVIANRHQVKFSLPFFIPTVQIGTFGAFNRFESLLPNRKVLFDVALAGPAAGGLLSLLMLLAGLILSHQGSLFQVPTSFFQGSVLVGLLSKLILGNALKQSIVDVHPLTIIGWLGLVITAINLMPAGQLDGGRIIQSIFGRKVAGRSTFATFIVLAIASLVNPLALYWAAVILILQRNLERPSLNELTEPDDTRAALGLLAIFMMIITLFPLTPTLASRLGIGG